MDTDFGNTIGVPDRHNYLQTDQAWNGYTVLSPLQTQAVLVIDMNGNVVKRWDGFNNSAGGPARIFPDGVVDVRQRKSPTAPGIA